MLAWSEGTDNGRQKPEIMVIVGGGYLLITPITRKLVTKPKTQNQQAPDATSFFPAGGCLPQAAWPERLSPKVRTLWHCSRLRSVALYL